MSDDNLDKWTWHKDDVVWERVKNPDAPALLSLEDRREVWKKLAPDEPFPPELQKPSEKTADTRRPKVKLHIHRK
jgi:hypothetical protein